MVTDTGNFLIDTFIVILFCLVPFVTYLFIMISLHQRIGKWYIGKVKLLDRADLSVFGIRNMMSAGIIALVFFVPIVLNLIFRPTFFDPSWNCYFLIGAVVAFIFVNIYQVVWLNYRTRKKK